MLPVLHAPPHHRSTRAQSKLIKRRLRAATGAMALLASALAFYWLLLRSPALGLPPATRSYDQQHVIRSTDQESSPVFNPGTVWVDQAGVPLQVGMGSPLPPSSLCSWWPWLCSFPGSCWLRAAELRCLSRSPPAPCLPRPPGGAPAPTSALTGPALAPRLQAHGGGVLLHKGVYYWYGEDKSKPTYMPEPVEGR